MTENDMLIHAWLGGVICGIVLGMIAMFFLGTLF
jgi:predicted lipid-binding transport protein (Tim44 family)